MRAGDAVLDPAVALDPVNAEVVRFRLFLALGFSRRIGRLRAGEICRGGGGRSCARKRNDGGEGKRDQGRFHLVVLVCEQAFSPAGARLAPNKRSTPSLVPNMPPA